MNKENNNPGSPDMRRERRLRAFESTATFGLLLLAIGLVAPFTDLENMKFVSVFKWIFGAGAIIYTFSRIAGGVNPEDSLRMKRLRRMEVWAGIAFCVATFFWFYNSARLHLPTVTLGVMRDTVLFTLAGALIQIIASWMMYSVRKKEQQDAGNKDKKQN